jgi:signal transduction histidine kinase
MTDESIEAKLARLEELEKRFDHAVQRAKLEAIKELAYGAGHEINNPLANIATRAQTLLRAETDPQKRRKLAAINAQAFRAHEMIADLMLFARPPQLRAEPVDLAALAGRVIDELRIDAHMRGIEFNLRAPDALAPWPADPTQLAVALRALLINAIEAMPHGGRVEVSIKAGSSRGAEIVVADNGTGIPAEIQPKIFDPFFSGREAGRGLGFGLSKAWRIVTLHGGTVDLHETPGGGATFVIQLPAASAER